MRKAYVCNRFPEIRIAVKPGRRAVQFLDGLYETDDPDEIAAIERAMPGNPIVPRDLPEEEQPEPPRAAIDDPEPPAGIPEGAPIGDPGVTGAREGITVSSGGVGTEQMRAMRK